jgi:hypothetical protein
MGDFDPMRRTMPKCKFLLPAVAVILVTYLPAQASQLFSASLRNGDYGSGAAVPTFAPNHGGSPGVLGIDDSAEGATYTSTEADGRSNALINWEIPSANRTSFRTSGTVSFSFRADRELHVGGSILGDNGGFTSFRHGQGTLGGIMGRVTNDTPDTDDDVIRLAWSTWHNNVWYGHDDVVGLDYNRWYNVGFAWGGLDNDFEIWVNGQLAAADSLPSGASLPWGFSGVNFGLGDNHERGYDVYGSVAGATFRDYSIWDEYVSQGNTIPEPSSAISMLLGLLLGAFRYRQRA